MKLIKYLDKSPNISVHSKIFDNVIITGDVTVKSGANIWYNSTLRGDMAPIVVGKNTNIQDNSVIHTNIDLPTIIGDDVTIGHGAIVHGAKIGNGSLIGMGSIILDGAIIEENCLIGAGTLVPPGKIVKKGSLVVGNPMRFIRMLTVKELNDIEKNKNYYLKLMSEY